MSCRQIFVYGTLRRQSTHPMAVLLTQHARFVGPATMAGRLYDLGRYPGMVEPRGPGDRVHGDLYDLSPDAELLERLDRYENGESPHPAYFDRQLAEVALGDGTVHPAWVYRFRGGVSGSQFIASGDWLQHRKTVD